MTELWNLLNFIEPKTFMNEDDFLRNYGNLKEADQVYRNKASLCNRLLLCIINYVLISYDESKMMSKNRSLQKYIYFSISLECSRKRRLLMST